MEDESMRQEMLDQFSNLDLSHFKTKVQNHSDASLRTLSNNSLHDCKTILKKSFLNKFGSKNHILKSVEKDLTNIKVCSSMIANQHVMWAVDITVFEQTLARRNKWQYMEKALDTIEAYQTKNTMHSKVGLSKFSIEFSSISILQKQSSFVSNSSNVDKDFSFIASDNLLNCEKMVFNPILVIFKPH